MKSQLVRHPHGKPQSASTGRRGFTLTEMLVVVGIIVLIVTISVPAFNAISGNRSLDAAQNQLAAIIGRARQEAIGLQQPYGVILFQDPNTSRACAAVVNFPDPANPLLLGLAPNHDELLLPIGVSFRMIETMPYGGTGPAAYYSSMNVVMFNARGEFICTPWAVLNNPLPAPWLGPGPNPANPPPPNPEIVALGARILPFTLPMYPGTNMLTPIQESYTMMTGGTPLSATILVDPNYVPATAATPAAVYGPSAFGFILFPDEGAYQNAFTNTNGSTTYLTDNGISFLINKYNGTLLRSE
jgi:prepilin-type N-terminal cleavage/methylation domain-containing protein